MDTFIKLKYHAWLYAMYYGLQILLDQLCCHIIWKGISLFAFLTYDKGISFIFQTAKTVKELGTSKITIRLKQGQLYFFLANKKKIDLLLTVVLDFFF